MAKYKPMDSNQAKLWLEEMGMPPDQYERLLAYMRTRTGLDWYIENRELYQQPGKKDEGRLYLYAKDLTRDELGAFYWVIEKCTPSISLFINKTKKQWRATPSFSYEHPGGGRNGCNVRFEVYGSWRTGIFHMEEFAARL